MDNPNHDVNHVLRESFLGKLVVIRPSNVHGASVWAGRVLFVSDDVVVLYDAALRVWGWEGAFTLSELATTGVSDNSHIAMKLPLAAVHGWCELLPCTDEAFATLTDPKLGKKSE